MAYASASDLLHIINDILDFSMIEQGELELDIKPFDLTAVVHETIQEMEMKAQKKGLEMACSIASDVPNDLIGDSGRLSQILRHLVENAVKFTNEGGVSVLVDVKQGPPETPLLHFSVKDTGIGIPLEKQQQIFEAFTQADGSLTRAYDGTGLGLTISSRIVHMMGGEIWVESTSGKGAVFHVDIPFERI
jgi:signal transduction histidine kinase